MCDTSLSFLLGPPDCSEGKRGMSIAGLLAVESVHLPHSHRHPLCQRQWTKLTCWTCDNWLFVGTVEIVTTGCLLVRLRLWQPAVWWYGWVCDIRLFGGMVEIVTTLEPIQKLNWTDVTWHSRFITITVNIQFIYCAGLQQTPPIAWSYSFYANTHRTMKWWLGRNKLSVQHNALDPEVWEMENNMELLMGPFKTKGLQFYVCLLQPVTTISLIRYTLQTKQSHTSQRSRAGKISFASLSLNSYWLWVQTASYKNG
jgi:hypothetical protein